MAEEAVLDVGVGLGYCAGMEEIYKDVAGIYCREAKQKMQNLAKYKSEKDWKNYRILIHAVKSNSKTIGCMKMAAQALDLEMAARSLEEGAEGEEREEKIQFIENNHEPAMESFMEAVETVGEYIGSL